MLEMFTTQEMLIDCSVFRSGEEYLVKVFNGEVLKATVTDRDDSYVGIIYSDGATKSMPVEEFNDSIVAEITYG
jgi:hypothetical protein